MSSPFQDIHCGVVVSVERETATGTISPPIRQRKRLEAMPALATGLGRVPRGYQQHDPTSLRRFAREALHQVAPSGVQDARCQAPIPHHVRDAEVFYQLL